jgi:hypothetical protein
VRGRSVRRRGTTALEVGVQGGVGEAVTLNELRACSCADSKELRRLRLGRFCKSSMLGQVVRGSEVGPIPVVYKWDKYGISWLKTG